MVRRVHAPVKGGSWGSDPQRAKNINEFLQNLWKWVSTLEVNFVFLTPVFFCNIVTTMIGILFFMAYKYSLQCASRQSHILSLYLAQMLLWKVGPVPYRQVSGTCNVGGCGQWCGKWIKSWILFLEVRLDKVLVISVIYDPSFWHFLMFIFCLGLLKQVTGICDSERLCYYITWLKLYSGRFGLKKVKI